MKKTAGSLRLDLGSTASCRPSPSSVRPRRGHQRKLTRVSASSRSSSRASTARRGRPGHDHLRRHRGAGRPPGLQGRGVRAAVHRVHARHPPDAAQIREAKKDIPAEVRRSSTRRHGRQGSDHLDGAPPSPEPPGRRRGTAPSDQVRRQHQADHARDGNGRLDQAPSFPDRAVASRPYSQEIAGLVARLSSMLGDTVADEPLFNARAGERTLVLLISSDRGLCGAYNTNPSAASRSDRRSRWRGQDGLLRLWSQGGSVLQRGYNVKQFITEPPMEEIDYRTRPDRSCWWTRSPPVSTATCTSPSRPSSRW